MDAALSLDYAFAERWHVDAAYRIQHFRYGKSSNQVGDDIEPESTSSPSVVEVGVGLSF